MCIWYQSVTPSPILTFFKLEQEKNVTVRYTHSLEPDSECITTDARDTITNTHARCQAISSRKSICITAPIKCNGRDIIRYTHSLQASALIECINNGRDTVDCDIALERQKSILARIRLLLSQLAGY